MERVHLLSVRGLRVQEMVMKRSDSDEVVILIWTRIAVCEAPGSSTCDAAFVGGK